MEIFVPKGFPDTAPQDMKRELDKVLDYWTPDRTRLLRNQRMVVATDYGQWPDEVVATLQEQRRQIPTINIIEDKIRTLIGIVLKNRMEVSFKPMSDKMIQLIMHLQDMYYTDADVFDFDAVDKEFIKDSLVMFGVKQMVINRRDDPDGNITFERCNPYDVSLDPYWTSPFSKEMRNFWKHPKMTAQDIRYTYYKKNSEIEAEYQRQRMEKDYDVNVIYPNIKPEERWADSHQVIEKHYLEQRDDEHEFDTVNREWFPDLDDAGKAHYAEVMSIGPDDIQMRPRRRWIYKVKASCPTLTSKIILEEAEHEIQINRLPFFPLAYSRYLGRCKGMVDTVYDLQQNINKAILDMSDIRARTAKGGGKIIDPVIFGNDETKKKEFLAMSTLPGYTAFSEPNAFQGGKEKYILEMPEATINQDHFAFLNTLFRMVDMLTTPAATEGRGESSKESGKLFQSKYEAGLIANGDYMKSLEICQSECAEGYYNQARITYSGSPRKFAGYGGKPPFIINRKIRTETGEEMPLDDISMLPRCKVVITQSPKSLNMRTNQRELYGDMWHSLPKNSVIMPYILMYGILDTLDVETPQIIEAKKMLELEKQNAVSMISASMAQNQLNEQMAKNQLQAMQNQGAVPPNPMMPGAESVAGPGAEPPPMTAEPVQAPIPEALPSGMTLT